MLTQYQSIGDKRIDNFESPAKKIRLIILSPIRDIFKLKDNTGN